jgi:hypothetical protein
MPLGRAAATSGLGCAQGGGGPRGLVTPSVRTLERKQRSKKNNEYSRAGVFAKFANCYGLFIVLIILVADGCSCRNETGGVCIRVRPDKTFLCCVFYRFVFAAMITDFASPKPPMVHYSASWVAAARRRRMSRFMVSLHGETRPRCDQISGASSDFSTAAQQALTEGRGYHSGT